MSSHAKLSPSSAHRWIKCAASVALPVIEGAHDLPVSLAAQQGTAAHYMLEKYFDKGIDPKEWNNIEGVLIENWILKAVQEAIEEIEKIVKSCPEADVYTEYRVITKQIDKSIFGTADIVIDDPSALWVIDYKNGIGVEVAAEENAQLAIYGLGAIADFGCAGRLKLAIVQPRARSGEVVKVWTIEADKIEKFVEYWKTKITIAKETIDNFSNLPYFKKYKMGDHCQWCDAMVICPAIGRAVVEVATLNTKNKALTDLTIKMLYQFKSQIIEKLKWIESYCMGEALNGKSIPGHKLVYSRTNRIWYPSEESIMKKLSKKHHSSEYTNVKLKTRKEIEQLAGKKFIEANSTKKDAKMTLVPNSDKRTAIKADVKGDFEVIK